MARFNPDLTAVVDNTPIKDVPVGDDLEYPVLVNGLLPTDEIVQAAWTIKKTRNDADNAATTVQQVINSLDTVDGVINGTVCRFRLPRVKNGDFLEGKNVMDVQVWISRNNAEPVVRTIADKTITFKKDITKRSDLVLPVPPSALPSMFDARQGDVLVYDLGSKSYVPRSFVSMDRRQTHFERQREIGLAARNARQQIVDVGLSKIHSLQFYRGRLYATRRDAGAVQIIRFNNPDDLTDQTLSAVQPNLGDSHDLLIVPEVNRGFFIQHQMLCAFDLDTLVVTQIPNTTGFGWNYLESICSDGTYLYVGDAPTSSDPATLSYIHRVRLSDTTDQARVAMPLGTPYLHTLRCDGKNLFATGTTPNPTISGGWIARLTLATCVTEQWSAVTGMIAPTDDMALTGDWIFIGLEGINIARIIRFLKSDLTQVMPLNILDQSLANGGEPTWCVNSDGRYVWICSASLNADITNGVSWLTRLDPDTMAVVRWQTPYNGPNEIAFDGVRTYVAFYEPTLRLWSFVVPPAPLWRGYVGKDGNIVTRRGQLGMAVGTLGVERRALDIVGGGLYLGALPASSSWVNIKRGGLATIGAQALSYWIVAYDAFGRRAMSPVKTIPNATNALSPADFLRVYATIIPGAVKYDILKGDTNHSIVLGSRFPYIIDDGTLVPVAGYVPPTRNETADAFTEGNFEFAQGMGVVQRSPNGTRRILVINDDGTVGSALAP